MEVEIYKDKAGEWRWRKTAANGRIVSESGESYTRYADCLEAAEEFADGEIIEVVGADDDGAPTIIEGTEMEAGRDEKDEANDAEQERLEREAEEDLRRQERVDER